jgi:Tol biopolymer transport system component
VPIKARVERAMRVVAVSLTLATAFVGAGCGGDEDKRAHTFLRSHPRIATVRDRTELVLFRVQPNVPGPAYDLVSFTPPTQRFRVVAGDSKSKTLRPDLFAQAAWSPDGRRLAFTGVTGRKWAGGNAASFEAPRDVYVMKADGSGVRRVTSTRDAVSPIWSPDGETIVFARWIGRTYPFPTALWAVAPDGSSLRMLLPARPGRFVVPSAFAPDGSSVALTVTDLRPPARAGRQSAVYSLRADGTLRKLSDHAEAATYSTDGRRIAFVSDRDHNGELSYGDQTSYARELYAMNADGSAQHRLTHTRDVNERSPSWSPDGEVIAFGVGRAFSNAEATSVDLVNRDGSCRRTLARGSGEGAWYDAPAWRPGVARQGGGRLTC